MWSCPTAASPAPARPCGGCLGARLQVDGRSSSATLDQAEFAALEPIPKDQWPPVSALIVTAELGAEDFAWLDGLRRAPLPARAQPGSGASDACSTRLPPSAERELRGRLARSRGRTRRRPRAIAGLMDLGGGVAFRVVSDDLDAHSRRARRRTSTACWARRTRAAGGRTSPSRTRSHPRRARTLLADARAGLSAAAAAASPASASTAISAGRGRRWRPTRSAALADVADPVAAQVERRQPGFEHRGQHRHVHQLVDRRLAAAARARWPPPSPRPSRRPRRCPGRPSRRRRTSASWSSPRSSRIARQLLLDAVVDGVVEHRQRALVLVVDIVGGLVAVIVGRGLRFIFARREG